ncbi:nose resistant to fluoxetine protein 6-like isoform X2 [Clavelina lepadiformis]|uniref:nose resistant to fluoxetine protein 6-like isoform X2 n=1 Tax=Clavelina lepadiformis TaxID=159417 RepID=UPI0040416104
MSNILLVSLLLAACLTFALSQPLTPVHPSDVVRNAVEKIIVAHNGQHETKLATDVALKVLSVDNLDVVGINCSKSIRQFVKDLQSFKHYTLEVLDSWAKPAAGILEGNVVWSGRQYECKNVQEVPFKGQFCEIVFDIPPTIDPLDYLGYQGISMGGCFPDTCSTEDVTFMLNNTFKNLSFPIFGACPDRVPEWEAKDIAALVVFCLILTLVAASTLLDYIWSKETEELTESFDQFHLLHSQHQSKSQQEKIHRILTSFSIIKNTKKLLDTTQRPTDITCLHGMRFLSMSWVILGHCQLFPIAYSDNPTFVANYFLNSWSFQTIGNGYYSVDTFFYLSGLLVAYLGMRTLKRNGGRINVPLMYLYRYIRLTPPYAFVMFMMVTLYRKMGDGPYWDTNFRSHQQPCSKYWWTNLLYINNLYPEKSEDQCFSWGWYLANDTQFYLFVPLFLFVLYRSKALGLGILNFVLIASMSVTGSFSKYTNQQPPAVTYGQLAHLALMISHGTNASDGLLQAEASDQYSPYMADLYQKPWCRIGAYIVGMITGYILYSNNNKIHMSKWVVLLGWLTAAGACCGVVYGLYPTLSTGGALNTDLAAFYNAVSRPVWCVGMAWVTIVCVSGYGGPVNTFLSWKGFIPLSRLTYCCYLLHPLVIWWFLATAETHFHFSIYFMIMIFLASLVLTHMLAYAVAMAIEYPTVELMKMLQEEGKRHVRIQLPDEAHTMDKEEDDKDA